MHRSSADSGPQGSALLTFVGIRSIPAGAYARAVKNLLAKGPPCDRALGDPSGDERHLNQDKNGEGRKPPLLQKPKAKCDLEAATGSVLARDRFVRVLRAIGEKWTFEFPKGSSHGVDVGVAFVQAFGGEAPPRVAKVRFGATAAVLREARCGRRAGRPG